MATIQKFEDLEIWQLARQLCQKIYPLIFQEPVSKDNRFRNQIRGTSGSIMDNNAEGFGRGSRLEFINALTTAKGEIDELKSQLYRGFDIHYFYEPLFDELYNLANHLEKKITAFITYLNTSKIKGQKFKERT